jgi:hypothetical protein
LNCPSCDQHFTRLGGLIRHVENRECKPAADRTEFLERVQEKTAHYDNPANMRHRVEYGQTSGDFRDDDLLTFEHNDIDKDIDGVHVSQQPGKYSPFKERFPAVLCWCNFPGYSYYRPRQF